MYRRQARLSITFGVVCACLCIANGFAHADVLDQIKERKRIVIAHRQSSFPFSYVDSSGNVRGYAIDLCLKVVEAVRREVNLAELPVTYLMVTPATRLKAIAAGEADLECGSTTNNSERRKQVDFTIPHFISSARVIVRADRNFRELPDLKGKKVVSTKGTTNIESLKRYSEQRNFGMQITEVADHAEGFRKVESGEADAFAMDDVLLFGLRARSSNPKGFIVIGKPMSVEPYAIMLPKQQQRFRQLVDSTMRKVILDKEIDVVYKKWFEAPIPPDGVNLELKMPYLLRDLFRAPTSTVNDWYLD